MTNHRRNIAPKSTSGCSIVWFRQDLRLGDNPALMAAVSRGHPVVPVYIWAPEEEGAGPPGGASKWWLHHSLASLNSDLRAVNSRLVLRAGPALETLLEFATETGAAAVFWNRRYEPAIRERDTVLQEKLRAAGLEVESFNAALLHEPWTVQNKSGKPFQVFTPFWRHCLAKGNPAKPLPKPATIAAPRQWPASAPLATFQLEPRPDWAGGLARTWRPGTRGARDHLHRFLAKALDDYETGRNRPDLPGTSRLSPHLHFGEISPRQVWYELTSCLGQGRELATYGQGMKYVAELGWREFSHHLLYHFPHTVSEPLRAEFKNFRWRTNDQHLKAWQRGQTGYPFVDAGMRELWSTGWMHNRVRMVVASFLVKDLLLPWQDGARWFWDTLVDADLAQNTFGWQWSAGCGADAAPYFRIFNPITQGEKFDPEGDYIRHWIPELARLASPWIHKPHAAPAEVLARAGVILGKSYPEPVINHAIAREVALEAYSRSRQSP